MIKKNGQNRYKPAPKNSKTLREHLISVMKLFSALLMVGLLSLAAVYGHDLIVQSPFLMVREISLSGLNRLTEPEILELADLSGPRNIFAINTRNVETQLVSHPWIAAAQVRRRMVTCLEMRIVEEDPMAIVTIENFADVLINTDGTPFKTYEPLTDKKLEMLPVITGLDLSRTGDHYQFQGPLFDTIQNLVQELETEEIIYIHGDDNIGATIHIPDTFNNDELNTEFLVPIHLGFDNFARKMIQARKIGHYITANLPGKKIYGMDLFDLDKVFVRTMNLEDVSVTPQKAHDKG